MYGLLINTITIVALAIASYTDLKTREVPDYVSYAFIAAAIGIRAIFAVQYGVLFFVEGIVGLLIFLLLSLALYHTGQWGGADAKLLMGMGMVIGLSLPWSLTSFYLPLYFAGLLFIGSVYGLLWIIHLAIVHRNQFVPEIFTKLKEYKRLHLILFVSALLLALASLMVSYIWIISLLLLFTFYLILLITAVENVCFYKDVTPSNLTEGDWLACDVIYKGKTYLPKKTLNKEDVQKLQNSQIQTIRIREGIPFVPAFLLTFIVFIIYFSNASFL